MYIRHRSVFFATHFGQRHPYWYAVDAEWFGNLHGLPLAARSLARAITARCFSLFQLLQSMHLHPRRWAVEDARSGNWQSFFMVIP